MTNSDQDRAIQIIAEEYDRVTIRQNAGPNKDRAVVVCPDGRAVVLDGDGQVISDSRRPKKVVRDVLQGLRESGRELGDDSEVRVVYHAGQTGDASFNLPIADIKLGANGEILIVVEGSPR